MLAGELAEAGTVGQGVEGLGEQFGTPVPVVAAEGLLAEIAPTVLTAETLDTMGLAAAGEEASADPVPGHARIPVEGTKFVGAERRHEGGGADSHAR